MIRIVVFFVIVMVGGSCLCHLQAIAQTGYYYDASGNRVTKAYSTSFLKRGDTTTTTAVTGGYVIKVFPNPAKEYFQIEIGGISKANVTSIEIHNLNGEVLFRKDNVHDVFQIPIKDWVVGTYFLDIVIDGKPNYWKLIKED